MSVPRRYLPSISLLAAFEATVRTGSVSAAARELTLTQGAVSRQVQALEEQLGVTLFRRERKRLVPTSRAVTYAATVRDALDSLGRASVELAANPDGGVLNLAILPTFGTRWLAPRLGRFLESHRGITVNVGTRIRAFDFAGERFDAAIFSGKPTWPGTEHFRLMEEVVVPVCSADLLKQLDVKGPADLLKATLLHMETRPEAWPHWFERHGLAARRALGVQFDQFATMARAAAAGLGVALMPTFLVESELAEGSLVSAYGEPTPSDTGYFLVWPVGKGDYPPLQRFKEWIAGEVAPGS